MSVHPILPLGEKPEIPHEALSGFTQMQQSAEAQNVGSCLYTQFDEGLRESIAIIEAQEKLSPWGSPLFGYLGLIKEIDDKEGETTVDPVRTGPLPILLLSR